MSIRSIASGARSAPTLAKLLDQVQRAMRVASRREPLEVVAPDPPCRAEFRGRRFRGERAAIEIAEYGCDRIGLPGKSGIA